MMLRFEQAVSMVKEKLSEANLTPSAETVPLQEARGRVLAEQVAADRDYPPFNRSTRDGYAVRSADVRVVPAVLNCIGEVRAGEYFLGKVDPGQCVQIMTGAPLPAESDAVVMVEQTRGYGSRVEILREIETCQNVVRKGSEAPAGSVVLRQGQRLGSAEIGLLAAVGRVCVKVFLRPSVAILTTGNEVVPIEQQPEWFRVRNSNAATLVALVTAAAGVPRELSIAPDEKLALRQLIEQSLSADLLLLSGGVSVGKYDFAEEVLDELGAEFFFQSVAIRPGKPLIFGRVGGKFFFGLPGNPVSTLVTFELFVRPAIGMLQGAEFGAPVFLRARLGRPCRSLGMGVGLTRFLPARVELEVSDPVVNPVPWQGSGDLAGLATSNCFMVVRPEQTELGAGEWVDVLPKPV